MTVKNLIEKLSKFDPLMDVFFADNLSEDINDSVEQVYTKELKFKESHDKTDEEEMANGTFAVETVVILDGI